jgi:exoribonuclease R
VQQRFDDGTVDPMLALLREVGELRLRREAERGGVSLPLPSQEVDVDEHGHWSLSYRIPLPVEQWNAQISLLTGMAAATLMTQHRVGLLRTLPPAEPRDLARLRRTARALGILWPDGLSYPEFIRSVDATSASGSAVLVAATRTLRGASYVALDGELPAERAHSALAAEYAHVTAPLRRLADRYTGEVCLALCAGDPVPEWVASRLPSLPGEMRASARRASQYERAILDLVEAAVLKEHVGTVFEGVIVSREERSSRDGRVMVRKPAIEAPVSARADLPLGEDVTVRLVSADVASRRVAFELA